MANIQYIFIILLQSMFFQSMSNIIPQRTCLREYWEVHVLNHLPSDNVEPLRLHCKSKDNDLGAHSITLQQDFNWNFCENLLGTTLFFCHLLWNSNTGPKHKVFYVFSPTLSSKCISGYCYWSANIDGIYFTGESPPNHWHKLYDWDNGIGTR